MTLAILVPDYSELGISSPYFGDRVYEWITSERKGRVERVGTKVKPFIDGSHKNQIRDNVRGRTTYLVHTQHVEDPSKHVMLTKGLLDAAGRSRVGRLTLIEPYNPFFRQDSRYGREPVTARQIADDYVAAGAKGYVCIEPHSKQVVGFFPQAFPVEMIPVEVPLARFMRDNYDLSNTVVTAPDVGAAARAQRFANLLRRRIAIVYKTRPETDTTQVGTVLDAEENEIPAVLGNVEGKDVLLYDDVVSTVGTVETATNAVRELGARSVRVCAPHIGLYGPARERIRRLGVPVIGTNTISHTFTAEERELLTYLDLAPIIGEFIWRDYEDESISRLFTEEMEKVPLLVPLA